MTIDLGNVRAIARREYLVRARTRTFRATTMVLIVVALGISLAPILLQWFDRTTGPATIEVYVGDSQPSVDVPAALSGLLNAAPTSVLGGGSGSTTATPKYKVVSAPSLDAGVADVQADKAAGLLAVERHASDHELLFTYTTKAVASDRLPTVIRQAAASIAIQDRLTNAGVPPIDQAKLFSPPDYTVAAATGASAGNPADIAGTGLAIGFVLAIVLFMAIVLYGQWVAYSVAEEKSSRVMEVILGAASPFELLGGKVAGVGALALTQYAIVFVPAAIATLFQDQIAAFVLGGSAPSTGLPAGLSVPLLLAFGAFFVLGFALYAVLYAGAAALVSRTEDINQIIAPLTILSTAGYLVAVYSSTGLISPDSRFVVILSFVPFFSPYLMLARLGSGHATGPEVLVAIAILAVFVPIALWAAARLYAAGVLMYGQRPSLRLMVRVLRGG